MGAPCLQVRIVDLGAIQPLAAMIDAEDAQLKERAAFALECLGKKWLRFKALLFSKASSRH